MEKKGKKCEIKRNDNNTENQFPSETNRKFHIWVQPRWKKKCKKMKETEEKNDIQLLFYVNAKKIFE